MTTKSLIFVICLWHCVVNGQLPPGNFDPYHLPHYNPYTSTFGNQPTQQNYHGLTIQSGENYELQNTPITKGLILHTAFLLQIQQQQQATIASLTMQLQAIKDDLATKAAKSDLDNTNSQVSNLNTDVSNLIVAMQMTNSDLATKADKTELVETNSEVSDLKTALQAITSPSSIGTIPSSCENLKSLGYVKSGIYSVVFDKKVQDVYCDFTKASDSTDFQKLIGYVNVKSKAVYFFAQRDGNYANIDTGIPFNKIGINAANALDTSTGEFEAPSSGKYFFAYTGLCWDNEAKIQLQTKALASTSWSKIGDSHCTMYNTLAITSTLQLSKGDRVRIFLIQGTTHDDGNNFTNYVGWLLEEDIV